jgi:hypothetical protein
LSIAGSRSPVDSTLGGSAKRASASSGRAWSVVDTVGTGLVVLSDTPVQAATITDLIRNFFTGLTLRPDS